VVAETTCDGRKRVRVDGRDEADVNVLELPQKADDPDAWKHWTREVRKLKEHLEQRLKRASPDEKLREAIG